MEQQVLSQANSIQLDMADNRQGENIEMVASQEERNFQRRQL